MTIYYQNGVISGLELSPYSGAMYVYVASGTGRIDGVEIDYNLSLITINSADETYDRIDAVYITPFGLHYVAGTPSLTPLVPDYDGPYSSCLIGSFTVPAECTDSDNFTGWSASAPVVTLNDDDYHLTRDSYLLLNRGVDLVDPYVDIDIDSESFDMLSIGADGIPDVQVKNLYFSVGTSTDNLMTGSNLTVSITDDIMTFSSPQTHDNVGAGCIVTCGIIDYFIHQKIDESHWIVKTALGESVDNLPVTDVVSIEYAYHKLFDLFADIGYIVGTYLRTAKYRLNVTCYKGSLSDNDEVTIRFFDTDIDNCIRIYTPCDVALECNTPQVHCGDPVNDNYKRGAIRLCVPNTIIDGIIMSDAAKDGVSLYGCQNVKIIDNIIYDSINGIVSQNDGHIDGAYKDDFSGGEISTMFSSDIVDNWFIKSHYDKYMIYRNENVPTAYEDLFATVFFDEGFDFEFSIVQRSSGDMDVAIVSDGAVIVAEMTYNQDSIVFNTTTVKANHKYGVAYRFRLIRGGVLSSDGIYQSDAGKVSNVSLYYFYNNVWNYIDDDYTGVNMTCNIRIKSSGAHGIGFVNAWSETDSSELNSVGSNKNNKFLNNLIYGLTGKGIISSGSDQEYNNTVDQCASIGFDNQGGDDLINNVATRCTPGFIYASSLKNCSSDDGSSGTMNGCIDDIDMEYVDYTSPYAERNYRPVHDAVGIRGNGLSLISSFNYDATKWPRDRNWDRGALEYIPNIVMFGISTFNGDVKSGGTYRIKIFRHYSIMIFSKEQTDSRLAIGYSVHDGGHTFDSGCVLVRKLSQYCWVVCDEEGRSITDRTSGNVTKIYVKYREFSSAQRYHYKPLIANQTRLTFVYYNDGSSNMGVRFYEFQSDVDHFLSFITPKDTLTECNKSHRHSGIWGDGAKIDSITFETFNCHYAEIVGLQISGGINIDSSGGHFIGYNILKNSGLTMKFDLHNIVQNNLIYEGEFGMNVGNIQYWSDDLYETHDFPSIDILNNTVSLCRQALRFYKADHKYTTTAYVKNNLFQYSELTNVACEYSNRKGNFLFKDNITSEQRDIKFLDRDNGNYFLDPYADYYAVDNATDLSLRYLDDIVGSLREPEQWDIGAFEFLEISGVGILDLGTFSVDGAGIMGGAPQTVILYLRKPDALEPEKYFLTDVDPLVQFTSIEGIDRYAINQYLADMDASAGGMQVVHLKIYTQGGITFPGTFTLYDRGTRNVTIETYPPEAQYGPSVLEYLGPIVDDASNQGALTFVGEKIFSSSIATQDYLVNDTALTKKIVLVNSIVQVNNDAIMDDGVVETINSLLVYRNGDDADTCWLSLTDQQCKCINSIIITYQNAPFFFHASPGTEDTVWNTILYNFSGQPFTFISTNSDCKPSTDPLLKDIILTERLFSIAGIVDKSFDYEKSSPAFDAGNDTVISMYDMITDIDGKPRVYLTGRIDIGPYELQVNNIIFESSDLEAVFQDKFVFTGEYFKTKTKIYNDLVITGRDEFCRESKVILRLKEARRDHALLSDKPNVIMHECSAYFDAGARSIILFKTDRYIGGLFKTIFDDGRYLFYYDDINNRLTIYVNDTYNKGLSGKNNVINNVKFGGSAVMV